MLSSLIPSLIDCEHSDTPNSVRLHAVTFYGLPLKKSPLLPPSMNIFHHGSSVSCKIVTATSVLLLAFVMVAPGVLGHNGSVAAGSVPSGYGGRAYGVYTQVPIVGGAYFADTGSLPAEGGVLVAPFVPVDTGVAGALVFLSYTRGFTDLAMSETATSDIGLLADTPYPVAASFGYTMSKAACDGASGAADVADLSVAGVSIGVTGEANQVYEILGVFKLIINEQIDSSSGSTKAITVNALHAWFSGIEVIVSSAYSSITCDGSSGGPLPLGGTGAVTGANVSTPRGSCEQPHDFVTGGGGFHPPNSAAGAYQPGRVNFGFNARARPGNPEIKGHLNAINHNTGQHLEGVNVDSYQVWGNDPVHCRTFTGDAVVDGTSGRYQAWVCDYAEPGRNDRFAGVVWLLGGSTIYWDNYD